MPEPDFEQIAEELLNGFVDLSGAASPEEFRGTLQPVVEQLRLVWNARGAADLAVFDQLSNLSRDHRQIVREEFERDLRGLDR